MPDRPGLVRFENYKHLILCADGNPFEGWTSVTYLSMEEALHYFQKVRAAARVALPAFDGYVVARFFQYEHPWCAKKVANGTLCPYPDPASGSKLVAEMEDLVGRQIRATERLLPSDVGLILAAAPALEGRIVTVTRDRWRSREQPHGGLLERPYSKVAEFRLRPKVKKTP
jgi:hypothetical protein